MPVTVEAPPSTVLVARRRQGRVVRARRIRRGVLVAIVLAGLTYGGWATAHSRLFALDRIRVTGAPHIDRAAVLMAAGIHVGMNVLGIDAALLERRLRVLPLVQEVKVVREYPSGLRIVIRERTPVAAMVLPDQERWLIDVTGIVIGIAAEVPPGTPVIAAQAETLQSGAVTAQVAVLQALRLWHKMPGGLRARVSDIRAKVPGAVSATVDGATIVFGDDSRLGDKIAGLKALFARATSTGRTLLSADLRAPSRPAARFA